MRINAYRHGAVEISGLSAADPILSGCRWAGQAIIQRLVPSADMIL